ncbi:hypothetical protein IPN35_00395 [Candidatus Peregrinibacteria bacterium]|nr:MAG: hypothetical protein IPN35_00395 [Candidatus Peregrinibacteria bacterium]
MSSSNFFQNSGYFAGVFFVFPFLLLGCISPAKNQAETPCLPSLVSISAYIPSEKERDFPKKKIEGTGVYIDRYTVLTVNHLLSSGSILPGYDVLEQFPQEDLALLKTEKCGVPLIISSDLASSEVDFSPCEQKFSSKKESEDIVSSGSKDPITGETKIFSGLREISGKYPWATSGMPLCNAKKELIALVVAVRENSVLVRPLPKFFQKRVDISP